MHKYCRLERISENIVHNCTFTELRIKVTLMVSGWIRFTFEAKPTLKKFYAKILNFSMPQTHFCFLPFSRAKIAKNAVT